MKLTTNFYLQEFVPKEVYERFADKSVWFVRPFCYNFAQFCRTRYGKAVTINNWADGGIFNYRGYRPMSWYFEKVKNANGLYELVQKSTFSQHIQGNAVDCTVEGMTPDEVRKDIVDNFYLYQKIGLTTIEDGEYAKTWVHADGRRTDMENLFIVKP